MVMKSGRRRAQALVQANQITKLALESACASVKSASFAKFDESVDLAARLGVNPKHADQMLRGAVVLPHGTGKTKRVVVFAKGEKASEAEAAGADAVGADDLVKRITEGWIDFDVAVATPDMMGQVGRLGRVLGPRGLMPNPKVGTVTFDVGRAVSDAKGGKVAFRVDRAGIVHVPVGRISFEVDKLVANARVLMDALVKAKPATAKGTYIRSVTLSSTMGPGVPVDPSTLSLEA